MVLSNIGHLAKVDKLHVSQKRLNVRDLKEAAKKSGVKKFCFGWHQ